MLTQRTSHRINLLNSKLGENTLLSAARRSQACSGGVTSATSIASTVHLGIKVLPGQLLPVPARLPKPSNLWAQPFQNMALISNLSRNFATLIHVAPNQPFNKTTTIPKAIKNKTPISSACSRANQTLANSPPDGLPTEKQIFTKQPRGIIGIMII